MERRNKKDSVVVKMSKISAGTRYMWKTVGRRGSFHWRPDTLFCGDVAEVNHRQ